MYKNLEAEMTRIGITKLNIAKELNYCYATLINKFAGKTDWHRNEMLSIRNKYFPDKSIEYLFETKK